MTTQGRRNLWLRLSVARDAINACIVLALAAASIIAVAACDGPELSLAPLYTPDDLVRDDTIVGTWLDGGLPGPPQKRVGEWGFGQAGYTIRKSNNPNEKMYLLTSPYGASELHLVRLGKYLFVDVGTPKNIPEVPKEKVPFPLHPVHTFGRITISPNVLLVRMASKGALNQLADSPLRRIESLLVSKTEELQRVVSEHADDVRVFGVGGGFDLCRDGLDCGLEVPLALVRDHPQDTLAGYQLAIAYMVRDRFDDAWAAWQKTPPPQPAKPGESAQDDALRAHRLSLAKAFIDWGRPESGLAVLKAGTEMNPNDFYDWSALGNGYLAVNRPQDALAAFQQSVSLYEAKETAELAQMPPPSPEPSSAGPAMKPGSDIEARRQQVRAYVSHLRACVDALAYMQMGDFEKVRTETGECAAQEAPLAGELNFVAYLAEGNYEPERLLGVPFGQRLPAQIAQYLLLRHMGRSEAAAELIKRPSQDSHFIAPLLELPVKSGSTSTVEMVSIKDLAPFFRGEIGDSELVARNQPAKGRVVSPELCIAYFMIGEKHLLDGDRNAAREYFQKSVDTHAYTYGEWIVANARVKQLSAK